MIEVQIRETCSVCAGARVVAGHAWETFQGEEGAAVREEAEATRRAGHYGAAIDLELAWFRERGWLIPPRDGYGEGFPPEEEPCPECEGDGTTTRFVDLDELARLMSRPIAAAVEEQLAPVWRVIDSRTAHLA